MSELSGKTKVELCGIILGLQEKMVEDGKLHQDAIAYGDRWKVRAEEVLAERDMAIAKRNETSQDVLDLLEERNEARSERDELIRLANRSVWRKVVDWFKSIPWGQ